MSDTNAAEFNPDDIRRRANDLWKTEKAIAVREIDASRRANSTFVDQVTDIPKGTAEGILKFGISAGDLASRLTGGDGFEVSPAPSLTRTFTGGLTAGVTEFAFGYATGPAKGVSMLGKALGVGKKGYAALGLAGGAVTDFVAFKGDDGRLADLIEEHPVLSNPVTRFLKTSPDDSWAEGRLKGALEGLGLGAATEVLFHSLRGLRAGRAAEEAEKAGNFDLAKHLQAQVDDAKGKVADAIGKMEDDESARRAFRMLGFLDEEARDGSHLGRGLGESEPALGRGERMAAEDAQAARVAADEARQRRPVMEEGEDAIRQDRQAMGLEDDAAREAERLSRARATMEEGDISRRLERASDSGLPSPTSAPKSAPTEPTAPAKATPFKTTITEIEKQVDADGAIHIYEAEAPNGTKTRIEVESMEGEHSIGIGNSLDKSGKGSLSTSLVMDIAEQIALKHPEITEAQFIRMGSTGGVSGRSGKINVTRLREKAYEKLDAAEAPKGKSLGDLTGAEHTFGGQPGGETLGGLTQGKAKYPRKKVELPEPSVLHDAKYQSIEEALSKAKNTKLTNSDLLVRQLDQEGLSPPGLDANTYFDNARGAFLHAKKLLDAGETVVVERIGPRFKRKTLLVAGEHGKLKLSEFGQNSKYKMYPVNTDEMRLAATNHSWMTEAEVKAAEEAGGPIKWIHADALDEWVPGGLNAAKAAETTPTALFIEGHPNALCY